MNAEQKNKIWALLPKEFKEEVKKSYLYYTGMARKGQHDLGAIHTFEAIFGVHNLTSDLDGEDLLYVPRKIVQGLYAEQSIFKDRREECLWRDYEVRDVILRVLRELFGSKCLLGDVESVANENRKSRIDMLAKRKSDGKVIDVRK